jgi:outer membrane lipoprotein SlyB
MYANVPTGVRFAAIFDVQSGDTMKICYAGTAVFLTVATLVSGCATPDARYAYPNARYETDTRYGYPDTRYQSSPTYYSAYGVVESIETTSSGVDPHNVAGTVIGGVIGGVLGHQIGSGRGNSVATVAGAVGGAVVGHEVEESNKKRDLYRVRIRLEGGGYQTLMQDTLGGLRVGDRVRVENDRVSRY